MLTDANINDVAFIGPTKTTDVKKVEPVKILNPLPESGKDLPSEEAKTQPHVPKENIDKAVSDINNYVQQIQRQLHFSVDEDSGKTVIKVIDSQTKELIRQIPGEDALNVAKNISEGLNFEIFNSYT